MPAGLQIWDANGVKLLDTGDRMLRILGVQYVYSYLAYDSSGNLTSYSNMPGSLVNAEFASGTPWYFYQGTQGYNVDVTISGTTLSWALGVNFSFMYSDTHGFVYYGVY